MRILLDTHVYLWWLDGAPELSRDAIRMITDADEVYVSAVSIWEAAIKCDLGKLSVDIALLINQIQSNGFQSLAVGMRHAATLSGLPPIHKDPFDRMLIAQALSEPLRLLTADRLLASYSDLVELV
ncbi:MAG: hypothetical protein RL717_2517 [Pseudomonadota bacterium]|jgi:PIN domain nuclease of toxin-antitoxin system